MSSVNYAAAIVLAAVLMQGCFESKGSSDKAAASSVSLAISSVGRSSSESSSVSVSSQASASSVGGVATSASSSQNSSSAAGPVLRSLSLSIPVAELQESHAAAATVTAAYADGTTKTLSSGITWQIGESNVLETKGVRLIAKGEGTATVRAKADGKLSPARSVTVYKVVHGHRLPPEPDPAINNSTLLGIDVNNNGVRDDVERWIYTRYDTYFPCKQVVVEIPGTDIKGTRDVCEETPVPYHRIVREIAMQGARAAQIVIQEPEKARETIKYMHAAQECNTYFRSRANTYNEPILLDHTVLVSEEFNEIQFNTVIRLRAYAEYNHALSGGVFESSSSEIMRSKCDFDVDGLLGK